MAVKRRLELLGERCSYNFGVSRVSSLCNPIDFLHWAGSLPCLDNYAITACVMQELQNITLVVPLWHVIVKGVCIGTRLVVFYCFRTECALLQRERSSSMLPPAIDKLPVDPLLKLNDMRLRASGTLLMKR